jgi:hypothetical protein
MAGFVAISIKAKIKITTCHYGLNFFNFFSGEKTIISQEKTFFSGVFPVAFSFPPFIFR